MLSNDSGERKVELSGVGSNSVIPLSRVWLSGVNSLLQLWALSILGDILGNESDKFPEDCGLSVLGISIGLDLFFRPITIWSFDMAF